MSDCSSLLSFIAPSLFNAESAPARRDHRYSSSRNVRLHGGRIRVSGAFNSAIISPPVANAVDDQTTSSFNSIEISWPASWLDPDDNLDSCYLTEGVGIYAAGQSSFTPEYFHLARNNRNPFNPTTTFELAQAVAESRLTVYNVPDRTVRTRHGENDADCVKVEWDATAFASGVYFYNLQPDNFAPMKKKVLLK